MRSQAPTGAGQDKSGKASKDPKNSKETSPSSTRIDTTETIATGDALSKQVRYADTSQVRHHNASSLGLLIDDIQHLRAIRYLDCLDSHPRHWANRYVDWELLFLSIDTAVILDTHIQARFKYGQLMLAYRTPVPIVPTCTSCHQSRYHCEAVGVASIAGSLSQYDTIVVAELADPGCHSYWYQIYFVV